MKLHRRVYPVQQASVAIVAFVDAVLDEYELTYFELLRVLADVTRQYATDALRLERHPEEPSKPADVE